MIMSKELMNSKLATWKKHVNDGTSKVFYTWHAFTGVTKDDFLKELEWLFDDPQDAVPRPERNPYRREIYCYPDGSIHRFIRIYAGDDVYRVHYEDYISGKLMRTTAPPSRAVGIDIWQPVEKITSREKADISAKAKEWHIINSKW